LGGKEVKGSRIADEKRKMKERGRSLLFLKGQNSKVGLWEGKRKKTNNVREVE